MFIGKEWKIESDEMNVTLYRRYVSKKSGREYWKAHTYYATVANALKSLIDIGVRDSELKDLKSINQRIDELYEIVAGVTA